VKGGSERKLGIVCLDTGGEWYLWNSALNLSRCLICVIPGLKCSLNSIRSLSLYPNGKIKEDNYPKNRT